MAVPSREVLAHARSRTLNGPGLTRDNPILIDDDEDSRLPGQACPQEGSKKRKATDLTKNNYSSSILPPKKAKRQRRTPTDKKSTKKDENITGDGPVEQRLRPFRSNPPTSYAQIAQRALTQRFCVLDRQRTGDLEEVIEMAGTTGNIYTITINQRPSCDCPHAIKGNQCKHIVYVLKKTLRAPEHLSYQLALLSSELQEIFANAPPIPSTKGKTDAEDTAASQDEHPNRKPIDDDCPICCDDFDAQHDEIVFCKATCGNNVHKACFDTWAKMKRLQGGTVTCPFCRTPWQDDRHLESIGKDPGAVGPEGYRNVAGSLGLSGLRDYSSYHQPWVRRQRRFAGGYLDDDDSMGDF